MPARYAAAVATVDFAILGSHHVGAPYGDDFWDAFDAVVETETGEAVLFGVRTAGYLRRSRDADGVEDWNGYRPLAVTLDRSSVDHWDFSQILWLGPEPHRCLIWSNATALSLDAVRHLLTGAHGARLLSGPDGNGLPGPVDLDVVVPESLERHRIDTDAPD